MTSRRFEELLAVIREQFDFVIVDTPPVLAVTDPGAVAARVDGVIMTMRLTKRTRADATHAVGVLSSLGANIFGVVVNGIDGRSRGNYSYGNQYGYGYGGGYNYGYGEGRSGAYYADEDEPMRTIPQR
ncbi:MAG: CpsD/CapB family tyrosine-protein kinase [Planctomycetes bacterium]|nr:CpsD/CapB family tyrosine-protein kinase [Planctomycetota bacterium]